MLFYEVLIGEIELRRGNLGNAYPPILDAARRTQDDRLFLRAVEIALRAQAGEQALTTAKAWRAAQPQSREACEYVAQILLALNRASETVEPLRAAIALTPDDTRSAAVASVPRFLSRITDHQQAAQLIDDITAPSRAAPQTAAAAWVASGRGWLAAGDTTRAYDAARKAFEADTAFDATGMLAAELIGRHPQAESLLQSQIEAQPNSAILRLAYARKLIESQRLPAAAEQLDRATQLMPQYQAGWLTLGAVRLDMREPQQAQTALLQYLKLRQAQATPAASDTSPPTDAIEDAPGNSNEQEHQAYLLLSQAAQQRGQLNEALTWLDNIPADANNLPIAFRRAALMQKLGRLNDAREIIHNAPVKDATQERAKILAEITLLRDAQRWREAYAVIDEAHKTLPDDAELFYEQGMLSEKLGRFDDMERQFRKVIALQPNNANAYNALGFSLADHNQRLPEARQLIIKALELSPGDPFITDSLGWVEYRLGHLDEAARLLSEAYKARPDAEIAAHLGEVLWQQGKHDDARALWRQALQKDANNETLQNTLQRLKVKP